MSDNDILFKGVCKRRWSGAYTQFVEWNMDPNVIAYSHVVALKKDLQELGNPPIYHLRDQAARFSDIQSEFLSGSVNKFNEYEYISSNIQSQYGNKRAMNLAYQASGQHLNYLLDNPKHDDHFYPMTRHYVESVYESNYETPVFRNSPLSGNIISDRFRQIRPIIEAGMDNFAKQLVRHVDVNKLKIPRGTAPSKLISKDEIDNYLGEFIRIN